MRLVRYLYAEQAAPVAEETFPAGVAVPALRAVRHRHRHHHQETQM